MKKILQNLYSHGITIIFFGIMLFLTAITAYTTSYVTYVGEHSYFLKDNIFYNLLLVILIILTIFAVKKIPYAVKLYNKLENDEILFKKCKNILLIIIFAMCFIWVISSQYKPGGDQYQIQNAVHAFIQKDYQMFFEGGYIAQCQNQLGMFFYSYICALIFGSHNYTIMQLINALGVTFIYKQLAELGALSGQKKLEQLLTITIGIVFLPLIMYSSFIYGNVLGLLFSLLAIKYEILFFRDGKKNHIAYSAIAILISMSMKSNYIIFMIGMIIYAIIEIISNKKWKHTTFIAALVIAYLVQANVPSMVLKQMTGIELGDEIAPMAYVAMGLQDSKRAPGWYNGYNTSLYKKSGYDEDVQNEMVKESINESFEKFKADKKYAGEFFIKKIASMYTEPSFQGLWVNQVRKSAINIPNWVYGLINVIGANKLLNFLNYFQFATYAGALLYCIFCRKKDGYLQSLTLLMIFIGGFICHIFWEAKGQYTLSYFVLLFPYAISGYGALFDRIQPKEFFKANMDLGITTVFVIIIIALLSKNDIMKVLTSKDDKEGYTKFVTEKSIGHITILKDGTYEILAADSGYMLSVANTASDELEVFLTDYNSDNNATINVATYQGSTRFWFIESDMYLEYGADMGDNKHFVKGKKSSITSAKQKWTLNSDDDGWLYIMYGTKEALTYNSSTGEVYVSPFTGNTNQQWFINADISE